MPSRDERLNAIVQWATHRPQVQAIVLTGSLARADGSIDEYSDIDVEVITSDPETLESDDLWLVEFGEPAIVIRLRTGEQQRWATRLVIYSDGGRVDFTIAGTDRIESMAETDRLNDLYERGYRVLLDKSSITAGLPAASRKARPSGLPTQHAFTTAVEEFWFEASHVPRYLERNELWLVKLRDWAMKQQLLRMAEWHAITHSNSDADTWHNGQQIEAWLDPTAFAELHRCFGRFDAADAGRAYTATIALFSRLAREVAHAASLQYPVACERVAPGLDA